MQWSFRLSFVFLFIVQLGCSQSAKKSTYQALFQAYENYWETSIQDRRFKHRDIESLILNLKSPFQVNELGQSIEGRPIYSVSIGTGPTKVLLWSQMHGDEPTATMALMDIFNFFESNDQFDRLRQKILKELTLVFVPMLNPDGAERYARRNALGVDLNRDALRLQTPEAKILKTIRDELDADWGFNLHDQSRYYSAGSSKNTAAISFLAPAFNHQKDINTVRGNSMKLIVHMNDILQKYIPGSVAKYNDTFEPRAFGDNIQKWGTSTILIEAGAYPNDPEKQFLRKLHFVILLSSFESIAKKAYQKENIKKYRQLPFNRSSRFMDLLLREVQIKRRGNWYTVDLGFRRQEIELGQATDFYHQASLSDLGDLSVYQAYNDHKLNDFKAVSARTYDRTLNHWSELAQFDPIQLLEDGITSIPVRNRTFSFPLSQLPIQMVGEKDNVRNEAILGQNPSFLLQKNGQTRFIVTNGQIFDLQNDRERIRNLWNQLFH